MTEIAVIGAGLAGCIVANDLSKTAYVKVYEKSNDKKYNVDIDMIFDVKSGPMNVTRKKNIRFILHKKKIN